MKDDNQSFYRPQRWIRLTDNQSRIMEIRQYLLNEQHKQAAWQLGEDGMLFKPGCPQIIGNVSLETTCMLASLGCKPYKRELIPTEEESEILYLEDLFHTKSDRAKHSSADITHEVKHESQRLEDKIPETLESAYELGRRGHKLGNWPSGRRNDQEKEPGSSAGS